MKLNHITDVFFDLDHTLWDFDKNSALTFKKIFKINNVNVGLHVFLDVYVPINFQYWKLYREERIDKTSLRYGRLKDAFDAINYTISDVVIHQLSEDYITYLSTFNHLFEGTIDLLEYLLPKYKLHIITNGFQSIQDKKMNNAKIQHYFKTITNSEMVGVKKPNPKIFHHALQIAQTKPDTSIMVGDNYEADILGALNFGIDAICFNVHNQQLEKHIKSIYSLKELKQYL